MIVCMVWDAVNDLLMGIIIENTHFRMGKFKPWILIGSISNAVVIIGLFTIRPQGWGFVAFYSLFYLLWGMTYTMNDIAYWGVLPSLSSDPGTRDSLVTIMSIFVCIGQFSVAGYCRKCGNGLPDRCAGRSLSTYCFPDADRLWHPGKGAEGADREVVFKGYVSHFCKK